MLDIFAPQLVRRSHKVTEVSVVGFRFKGNVVTEFYQHLLIVTVISSTVGTDILLGIILGRGSFRNCRASLTCVDQNEPYLSHDVIR
jgi:hypothetical protein